ncbi:MAG: Ycf51 family protein [Synechococcus sp.]
MTLPQLVQDSAGWLAWSGLGFAVLTVIAFVARWGLRFRLVGVTSFTLLLTVSSWAFTVSYTPPVVIEGAVRVPVVFDNGNDLVIAQAPATMDAAAVTPTLEQLAGNLRSGGRSSKVVMIRLRQLRSAGEGVSEPVILGQTEVNHSTAATGVQG